MRIPEFAHLFIIRTSAYLHIRTFIIICIFAHLHINKKSQPVMQDGFRYL